MNQSVFSFMSVHSKERDGKTVEKNRNQRESLWNRKEESELRNRGIERDKKMRYMRNLVLKINQTYTSSSPKVPQADQYPLCLESLTDRLRVKSKLTLTTLKLLL